MSRIYPVLLRQMIPAFWGLNLKAEQGTIPYDFRDLSLLKDLMQVKKLNCPISVAPS